jgi:hypothetical protein
MKISSIILVFIRFQQVYSIVNYIYQQGDALLFTISEGDEFMIFTILWIKVIGF